MIESMRLNGAYKKVEIDLSKGEQIVVLVKASNITDGILAEFLINVGDAEIVLNRGFKAEIKNVQITLLE